MSHPASLLPAGFRFHPTDEELILHYLRNRATSMPCPVSIIAEINVYKFDPWDLPAKAIYGDREWYFFSPRDRKYPNGVRPNRAAVSGYWKATGTDKLIYSSSGNGVIGVKKALVFYNGRPPKGFKTNWIMHEYRLTDSGGRNRYKSVNIKDFPMRLDNWVICRIYEKNNNQNGLNCYGSIAEDISVQENTSLKLQKSFSISEFFLDDYSELLEDPQSGMTGQVNGNTAGSSVNQPFADRDVSASSVDQFDVFQYSMVNKTLLNEQLLQNSDFNIRRHPNTNTHLLD